MQPAGRDVSSSHSPPPASQGGGPAAARPAAPAPGRGKWALCLGVLSRLDAASPTLRSLSARVGAAFAHRQRVHDQRRLDGLARLLRENYQLDAAPVLARLTELNARVGEPDFRTGYRALYRALRTDVRDSARGREDFEAAVHDTLAQLMPQVRQAMGTAGPSSEGRATVLADLQERRFNPFLAQRLAEAVRVGRLSQGDLPEFEAQVRETAARLLRENKASVAGFAVTDRFRHKALLEAAVGEALDAFRPEGGRLIPDERVFHDRLVAGLRSRVAELQAALVRPGQPGSAYAQAFERLDALAGKTGTSEFAEAYNAMACLVDLAQQEWRSARSAGASSGTRT